jgi:hypothetical protein
MTDESLILVRETARAYAEAVRDTQRFFDRIADTADPAVLVEYANLVEREKAAAEDRLDAIEAAGFEVPSIDESDPDA